MGMFWQNQAVDFEITGVSIVLSAVKKRSLPLWLLKRWTRYKDKIRIKLWSITAHIVYSHKYENPFQIIPEGSTQQKNSTAFRF